MDEERGGVRDPADSSGGETDSWSSILADILADAPESREEGRLAEALAAYMQASDSGEAPSREKFLASYPELASELEKFFSGEDILAFVRNEVRRSAADTPAYEDTAEHFPPRRLGDHEILCEIARGGMGVVYRARHCRLGRIVALKVLRGRDTASGKDLDRFRLEARAAAALNHPGIVQIHEIGEHEGEPFITMQFIEGASLVERIPDLVGEHAEMARLMEKVARAVHFAHQHGILHRDLKPANILVDPAGEPHLTDFGLAKVLGGEGEASLTRSGTVVGTLRYMAPEQASGSKGRITTASDVYSLGAILYELLSGRALFDGDSSARLFSRILHDEPPPPSRLHGGIPRDLETICLKCIEKAPEKRYPSAAALADDLHRFLEGEPIVAKPVGPFLRLGKWLRRNPVLATSTLAVFFALTGWLVGSLILLARIQTESESKGHAIAAVKTERDEKSKALERAEGLRLLALSEATLSRNPGQALLLAIEGARREPGLMANNALLSSALEVQELRAFSHDSVVHTARFSQDGKKVAGAALDTTVRIWDVETGKLLHYNRSARQQHAAAFSPDGALLLTAGPENPGAKWLHLNLWDVSSGARLREWRQEGRGFFHTLEISPDGTRFLAGTQEAVLLRSMEDGTVISSFRNSYPGAITCAAFSPDGRRIATGCDDSTVRIWTVPEMEPLAVLEGHSMQISGISFSRDGRHMATGGQDRTARVWDVATRQCVQTLPHAGPVTCVSFSPDGSRIATTVNQTGFIWDAGKGRQLDTLKGHTNSIESMRFSPDGGRVVTSSPDYTVRVWDIVRPAERFILRGHEGSVSCLSYSTDGGRLVTASSDGTARVWNLSRGGAPVILGGRGPGVLSVDFRKDGRSLITASGRSAATVWDAETGVPILALSSPPGSAVQWASFSPDGSRIVAALSNGTALLWDAASGTVLNRFAGHAGGIVMASFCQQGNRIITASRDRSTRIWDATTSSEVQRLVSPEAVFSARFDYSGERVVTSSWDRTCSVWDVATGKEIRTLGGHHGWVFQASFSPDGKRVVTAGADGAARIWDPETGKEVLTLRGHEGSVLGAAFSPDGRWVATGSADGSARIWKVVDLLDDAVARKPRDLTPEEMDFFEIGSPTERLMYSERLHLSRSRAELELVQRHDGDPANFYRSPYFNALERVLGVLTTSDTQRDLDEALRIAQDGVRRTGRGDAGFLGLLAGAQEAAGQRREAVKTLEEGGKLRKDWGHVEMLDRLRREMEPDLASCESLDLALDRLDRELLVPENAEWRILSGGEPSPPFAWVQPPYDDSSWERCRFAGGLPQERPQGWGMVTGAFRLRGSFQVPAPMLGRRSILRAAVDRGSGGFIAWVNGVEAGRWRADEDGTVPSQGGEDEFMWLFRPPLEIWIDPGRLVPGKNLLAIHALPASMEKPIASLLATLEAVLAPDRKRDEVFLARFRSLGDQPGRAGLIRYLEGRILARHGALREAADVFDEASKLCPESEEPVLRRAEVLEALGDLASAKDVLAEAIEGPFLESRAIWEAWVRIVMGRMQTGAVEALSTLPGRLRPAGPLPYPAGTFFFRQNLAWALERMARERAIRLDCGGSVDIESGVTWGMDRFFQGGGTSVVHHPIRGADAPELYQSQRMFRAPESAKYAIPLPKGKYRVVLHFAELFLEERGRRVFDVSMEGQRLLENYEPNAAGRFTADRKAFTVDVEDGSLDITFHHRVENPILSAIEVEALE